MQGVPVSANLGQADKAEQSLRLADGFIDSVRAAQPSNRTALLRSAEIARFRMILADINRHQKEATDLARKSSALLEKFNAQKSDQAESSMILSTY